MDGVEIINEDGIESNNEQGGQKSGQKTIDIILQLIKDDPTITRNAIAEIIGISPSAIQKHINRLKEDNVIVRQGGDRGGFWKVLEN